MDQLHPFAEFVAILARGKTKVRPLTIAEAERSMAMILRGEVEPVQIGAFLMLLRLKEETPAEIAGFTLAARSGFTLPANMPAIDLDWSSYAGKRIQLPWFLLSALALSGAGVKVFMHGTGGHTPKRIYTEETLKKLGLPIAASLDQAADHIGERNFAYMPLKALSPALYDLIGLRPLLGLRSPVHSFSRMLNPFRAPVMLQGIFHRGFMQIHTGAAMLLNQPKMAVFRGEGGEIERRPNKTTLVMTTSGKTGPSEQIWPAILDDPRQPADEEMNISALVDLWRGHGENAYASAAVVGTLAIALAAMGKASDIATAKDLANRIWAERDKTFLAQTV